MGAVGVVGLDELVCHRVGSGYLRAIFDAVTLENRTLMAEFTQAQLDEIYADLVQRGAIQRRPITQFGDPRFTAGRAVGIHTDGYIPKSLIQTSDLTSLLSGTYSPFAHTHNGSEITAGTVAEARIDAAIARDAEVAAAYSPIGHNHTGVYAPLAHTQAMSTITDYVAPTTWTPEVRFNSAANVGMTYGTRTGYYWKIGRSVIAVYDVTLTNKGAQAGTAAIFGPTLPVILAATGGAVGVFFQNTTTSYVSMLAVPAPGAGMTAAGLWGLTAAAASYSAVTNTNISNTTRLLGQMVYAIA